MNIKDYPVIISFIAGIISFVSPCILPLIPAYISFISGYSVEELMKGNYSVKKNLITSVLFVLGFTFIFTLLGASATFIGNVLGEKKEIIRYVGGAIVIIFGLHLAGVIRIKSLYKEKKIHMKLKSANYFMSFVFGSVFAVGWTPCVGPVLSSILIMASMEEKVGRGILLLFFYSLGLGLPFILTSFIVGKMLSLFSKIKRFYRIIEIASGLILILIGILLLLDKLRIPLG